MSLALKDRRQQISTVPSELLSFLEHHAVKEPTEEDYTFRVND